MKLSHFTDNLTNCSDDTLDNYLQKIHCKIQTHIWKQLNVDSIIAYTIIQM